MQTNFLKTIVLDQIFFRLFKSEEVPHPQPRDSLLQLKNSEDLCHCSQVLSYCLSVLQRGDGNANQNVDDHDVCRKEEPDEDDLSRAFKGDDGLGEGVVKLQFTSHHGGNFEQGVDRTLEPGETSY